MIYVMNAGGKKGTAYFEWCKDALERRRVQEHICALRNVGSMQWIMKGIVLNVMILERGHKCDESFRWYHQCIQ